MSPQEATRQRVVDLLRAPTAIKTIMEITGAKKTMIYDIRSKMKAETDLEKVTKRQSRPPTHKKLTEEFLEDLKARFTADPHISMRKMGKTLGVSVMTIKNGMKILGLVSRVQPKRQLLTGKQKDKRLVRSKKILNALKHKPPSTVRIFSDKKNVLCGPGLQSS